MYMRLLNLPPPPLPPPLGPPLQSTASELRKKKLYQTISAGKSAAEGDYTEARLLLSQGESSFRKYLQWILFNKFPSLMQDGPHIIFFTCYWMAAHLRQPQLSLTMDTGQTAFERGYTAQGEMFSAHNMALLAEEVCECKADTLTGGLSSDNSSNILTHVCKRQPILIPDHNEDFNHEPCQQRGHRAQWAVASGVLLGLDQGSVSKQHTQLDPTLPWLLVPKDNNLTSSCLDEVRESYVLAKQGKSLHYQLWNLTVSQSNFQLREMDPLRGSNGIQYIVPQGGVEAGPAGMVVLLHTGAH
ncbi:LOW QUALITY PROTEIN: actin maturation protease-like [Aplochiton taeniatus]